MAYKRKRVYAPAPSNVRKRAYKKRRFIRRRGRKVFSITNQNSKGYTPLSSYKKKGSYKLYKRRLWNSTIDKPKYRSWYTNQYNMSTPASYTSKTVNWYNTYFILGVDPFWLAAGGAVSPDSTLAMPIFSGQSIVLRGGVAWLTAMNTSDDTLEFEISVVRTKNHPDFTILPAGTYDKSWSLQMARDIDEIGFIKSTKRVLLIPGETFRFEYKLSCQAIDDNNYAVGGNAIYFVYSAANMSQNTANTLSITRGYSLSFVGDAT